jgi:hypothetical protein
MSTTFQDIQTVRSFRKEIREPYLSSAITNAIDTIHECLQSGTDLNGWKKVNWRDRNATVTSGSTSSTSLNKTTTRPHYSERNDTFRNNTSFRGNSFFKPSTTNAGSTNSTFGSANGGKYKNYQSTPPQENDQYHQQSFPLSNTNPQSKSAFSNSSYPVTNTPHTPSFSSPHSKYVSKFKKDTDAVDDTIINTIILGKLNKMSVNNYDEIKEFITHIIDSEQTEMTKCFMRLVFQKATVEEIFCPLYAKLLSELSIRYPVLLTEMTNLYNSYMAIFEEVEENNDKNYTEFVKRNVEKKYRRGYSQFLAELIKHGVINTESFMKTIHTIVKQVELSISNPDSIKLNEEYADCLIKIVNAIKSDDLDDDDDNIEEIKNNIKKDICNRIKPFTIKNTDNKGISTKTRFSFLNIVEDIDKF